MHQTKTDAAFLTLKDEIVSGRLGEGEWIRPNEWSERLHSSSIPVREALRRLEAQGLVEIDPHRGARVTSHTQAQVEETYLIRIALETLAARIAMERVGDREFDDLVARVESLTEQFVRAVENDESVTSINEEIHMAIYRASGLRRLVAILESLWAKYPFRTLTWASERRKAMVDEHLELLRILRLREPTLLADWTEGHIKGSQTALFKGTWGRNPPAGDGASLDPSNSAPGVLRA